MPLICPTVLAANKQEYEAQLKNISGFAKRIQIDLTDGNFAKTPTISPVEVWWPVGIVADIHLMYQHPMQAVEVLVKHQPHLLIVHSESDVDMKELSDKCRGNGVKLGLALLADTEPEKIKASLALIDHCLIFSGDLGSFGGRADLGLLEKVAYLKKLNPELEIGWDGGINTSNVSEIVFGGVDVLNVGGFIQKADDAEKAYNTLFRIAEETGTT